VARTHPEPPERHGGVLPESRRSLRRRASGPIDPAQEVIVNERRARELVARERTRVEGLLAARVGEIRADGTLQRQQTGEYIDAASALDSESVSVALAADLREQLAAVGRAEERVAQGTYGRSIESGLPIPDERLEAEPLAERTIDEQRDYETHGSRRFQ
jgi:DnaK suppressor protein